MSKLDIDLLKARGRKRVVLHSCITAVIVYLLPVFPIEIYGFQFGELPLWQKHLIALALSVLCGIGIYLKHTRELRLSERFKRRWVFAGFKMVTGSVFLYIIYSVFCIVILLLTWPYYKGLDPEMFFMAISFHFLGLPLVIILGVVTGLIYWILSAIVKSSRKSDSVSESSSF